MNIIETELYWNGTLSKRATTEYIALHHAEASKCSVYQVDDWHKSNGWLGIGYHFFVRKDGSIYRGRPLWAQGSHVLHMNNRSIGICAEGAYMTETMPEAQKRAIAELLDYLKTNYYPDAKIVGHKEIGSSNCPGDKYPLAELKNYKKILKEDEPMTTAEKAEMEALKKRIEELEKKSTHMIYNYVDDNMPSWAKDAVQAAINKGAIIGEGDGLGLTYSDLRTIVREYRSGLYN